MAESAAASAGRVSGRVEGIDVARGVAGLVMIGGHATHGWVHSADKETLGYAVTRLFGTLPLPAFLVLAGAAVAWRVDAAAQRGEDAALVRRRITLRGLQIVAWGYVVSALYALIDGSRSLDTLLRADVLHVIGLSIAAVAWIGIRARSGIGRSPDPRRLTWTALAVGAAVTVACPWLTELGATIQGPSRYLLGLLIDVPGVTRMPLVPLAAWLCVGVGAAQWMLAARRKAGDRSPSGAPSRTLWSMGIVGLAAASVAWWLTPIAVSSLGDGPLSRAHPAVLLNVIDLAGRGVLILAAGALLASHVRGRARRVLLELGRGSLIAYVFHIPFCYGTLGRPFIEQLSLVEALIGTTLLMAFSYGAVVVRVRWREIVGTVRRGLVSRPGNPL